MLTPSVEVNQLKGMWGKWDRKRDFFSRKSVISELSIFIAQFNIAWEHNCVWFYSCSKNILMMYSEWKCISIGIRYKTCPDLAKDIYWILTISTFKTSSRCFVLLLHLANIDIMKLMDLSSKNISWMGRKNMG